MAVVNLDDPSDVAAWNRRAPAPASQPVAASVGMEPVYQIGQPFLFDPENTWRDASKDAYDVHMPNRRRIIYTAAQVQAMLAAVPRNAPLYSPDDVAFPVQRSAEGVDVPPELASTARPTSIAAEEVTSVPIKAGEYPPLVCDYCGALTPDPWHSSGMLHGKMSKHIHSCDVCAARGQKQRGKMKKEQLDIPEEGVAFRDGWRSAEMHHGITAAQKGGQHGTE